MKQKVYGQLAIRTKSDASSKRTQREVESRSTNSEGDLQKGELFPEGVRAASFRTLSEACRDLQKMFKLFTETGILRCCTASENSGLAC